MTFAGLAWVLEGRALKPVENLRRQAADISLSDLHTAARERNLMENADRYAASRIVVTLQAQEDEAVLVVCDDGPGIPEADRDRILERFTRLDDTRTRSTGGVGRGLAIVDEVVAAHGGSLSVEEGAPGARMVLRLPRA